NEEDQAEEVFFDSELFDDSFPSPFATRSTLPSSMIGRASAAFIRFLTSAKRLNKVPTLVSLSGPYRAKWISRINARISFTFRGIPMSSSLTWTSRSTSNHELAFLVANATLRHNDLPQHFCSIGAI